MALDYFEWSKMYLEFGLDVDRGLEKGDGDAVAILNARSSIARSGTNCFLIVPRVTRQ